MAGLAPFLPVAGGLLGGLFGGGSRSGPPITSSQAPDEATAKWLETFRNTALNQYNQGPNAATIGAQGAYGGLLSGLTNGMQTGLGGLDQYLNPYMDQVVDAARTGIFDPQRDQARLRASDLATKAGAFGGDRSAILESQMVGDVNRNEASTLASLRQSGFEQAVNQLLAERSRQGQMGLAGAQGLFGIGQQLDQRQLAALQQMLGGLGFGGTTSSQSTFTNPYANILGGATSGLDIYEKLKSSGIIP